MIWGLGSRAKGGLGFRVFGLRECSATCFPSSRTKARRLCKSRCQGLGCCLRNLGPRTLKQFALQVGRIDLQPYTQKH